MSSHPEASRGDRSMRCAPECNWPDQPVLIPMCCVCGLIRDDSDLGGPSPNWIDLQQYRQHYGLQSTDLCFTHTYCPTCLVPVQERVRQYVADLRAIP